MVAVVKRRGAPGSLEAPVLGFEIREPDVSGIRCVIGWICHRLDMSRVKCQELGIQRTKNINEWTCVGLEISVNTTIITRKKELQTQVVRYVNRT